MRNHIVNFEHRDKTHCYFSFKIAAALKLGCRESDNRFKAFKALGFEV